MLAVRFEFNQFGQNGRCYTSVKVAGQREEIIVLQVLAKHKM